MIREIIKFIVLAALGSSLLSTSAIACPLAALAGHEGAARAERFAEVYRFALNQIQNAKSFTDGEREALARNPFSLANHEGGRSEARTLLDELAKALLTVDESERGPLIERLKLIAREKRGIEIRETGRAKEKTTQATLYTPEHSFIAPATLEGVHMLPGGKKFFSIHGLHDFPTEPNARFRESRKHAMTYVHPSRDWAVVWASPHVRGRWLSLNPKLTLVDRPLDLNDLVHPEGGVWRSFHFSSDPKITAAMDANYDLYLHDANGVRAIGPDRYPLQFSANNRKLWLNRREQGIYRPFILDVETGTETPLPKIYGSVTLGAGRAPGTIQLTGFETIGTKFVLYFTELDALTGEIRTERAFPGMKRQHVHLLGSQPVWLNTEQTMGTFQAAVISKDTGETVANGRWDGMITGISATPDGTKISIEYQKSTEENPKETHVEVFDLQTWLRVGTAGTHR